MRYSLHLILLIGSFLLANSYSMAQNTPFQTIEYIDINNIKAAHLVHGDMWHDTSGVNASCEFPKGSGNHVGFTSTLWMAGYDNGGQLRVAGQTYRNNGIDFWPGPLSAQGSVSYAESEKWAKIWKVERASVDSFLSNSVHTLANTPASILDWPGTGNIYATGHNNVPLTFNLARPYAPFNDLNNNNVYEPLQGEYPVMKGDQMLWYIYNDSGPTHSASMAQPLGVEVKVMVYAYKNNSIRDNIVFYDYELRNQTSVPLDSFAYGIFADMDLGYGFDDYIGFDSSRNLAFIYNGDSMDGMGSAGSYGDSLPIAGIRILSWNFLDSCQTNTSTGSFMLETGGANGAQMNYSLRSTWSSGQHLTNDYQGPGIPASGLGAGPLANYAFPGNPTSPMEWSECASTNPQGDRRFVIASHPQQLLPGQGERFSYALVVTPRKHNNACPNLSFQDILDVSDTAKAVYCNPPIYTSVNDGNVKTRSLNVYPNPANGFINIATPARQHEEVVLFDGIGKIVSVQSERKGDRIEVNIGGLAKGIYHILYRSEGGTYSGSFIKE